MDQELSKMKVSEVVTKLNQIISALHAFENNQDKKFNFTKLVEYLEIPSDTVSSIMEFIMNFQELITKLNHRKLAIKTQGAVNYFVTKEKEVRHDKKETVPAPRNIKISKEEAGMMNDLVYSFKNVRSGAGFNLDGGKGKDHLKINALKEEHPYFFFKNGNDLYYPSEMSITLGEKLLAYKKTNREINQIMIDDSLIIIKKQK